MDKIKDFEVNSPRWLSLDDFEGEVWKKVVGYEEYHEVSNYGRVKFLGYNNGNVKNGYPKILKQFFPNNRGCYWLVDLYKNGKSKHKRVHRLVAEAFLPNPDNLPEVNHKDENKKNPHLDNLEWCTRKYNANYGTMPERMREHMKKRMEDGYKIHRENRFGKTTTKHKVVHQYDLCGNYIATYYSQKEAELKTGINRNNICDVCKGRSRAAGGYIWTYTKEKEEIEKKILFAKGMVGKRKKKIVLPIEQYTLDDKYLCTYKNALSAAKENNLCYTSIIRCAKGEWKRYGGFIWKYKTLL